MPAISTDITLTKAPLLGRLAAGVRQSKSGVLGQVAVDLADAHLYLFDGTTYGGKAVGFRDLSTTPAATPSNDGKMTAAQAAKLSASPADPLSTADYLAGAGSVYAPMGGPNPLPSDLGGTRWLGDDVQVNAMYVHLPSKISYGELIGRYNLYHVIAGVNSSLTSQKATQNSQSSQIASLQGSIADLQTTKVNVSALGAPNGVAQLGADNKLVAAQVPDGIVSGMQFMGAYNPATDTLPPPSAGNKGWTWRVTASGNVAISGTADTFEVANGDMLVSRGETGPGFSGYDKFDCTQSVPMVFGRTGNITGVLGDYSAALVTMVSTVCGVAVTTVEEAIVAIASTVTAMQGQIAALQTEVDLRALLNPGIVEE